jgi:predicted nucleic acid-binding protein
MSDKCFLDTNVLVYTFDESAPEKREISREILAKALREHTLCLSWQVLQEFGNVALHKFERPMPEKQLRELLQQIYYPHCEVFPSLDLLNRALDLHQQTQYRFYDSLIVASALEAGADILYSEDLQHGRRIDSLEIVNPFLKR